MKTILRSLFCIAGLVFCTSSIAQHQIFVKAIGTLGDGLGQGTFDGGSTAVGHHNEIEAFAYSDGLTGCANFNSGGGGGACRAIHTPFEFSMPLSFAVISFKYNLLVGRTLTSVDLVVTNSIGEGSLTGIYKIRMEDVSITSIKEGASGGEIPTFNIGLHPGRIAWQVIKRNADGVESKFSFGWDFRQNRKFSYAFP